MGYGVTGITYGTLNNGGNVTVDNLTYLNDTRAVETMQIDVLGGYTVSGVTASNVYFRRGATGGNQGAVLYQNVPGNTAQTYAKGDSTPTLNEVMLSSDLGQSLWNPFNNTNTSGGIPTSSIERIDFFFSGGYVVKGDEVIVLFDFENPGNKGDPFRVAAYTAVDGSNTPTAYASNGFIVQETPNAVAVPPPNQTNAQYIRSVTTYNDNLYTSPVGNTNQTIVARDTNAGDTTELSLIGRAILLTDLGVTAGQTIFGYSLIAGDTLVDAGNVARLVNWQNTAYYLNNTSSATDAGNIDFMGFGAQLTRRVPEPSTYGMIFVGVLGGFFAWRRYRANATH
ncbi:PEP-CTERM sorting domain-containing protein [Oleiharenicola lentus]|uniref:PEP-CTERM sorting domain-containing protein n=1 Tax=Oleiharenicola lentus TaxID=2508720 RepID=UPI003F668371